VTLIAHTFITEQLDRESTREWENTTVDNEQSIQVNY